MFVDLIVLFHIFLCLGLIGLILIQHGKGADAGAAFGSGASATVFGSQGSGSFLTRTTAVLATTFFITSLSLAYFSMQRIEPKSVVESVQQPTSTTTEVPVTTQNNTKLPPVENSSSANEEVPVTSTDNEIPVTSE